MTSAVTRAILFALLVLLFAEATGACPPPPPPPMPPAQEEGETAEAYAVRVSTFNAEQEFQKKLANTRWEAYREGYEAGATNAASQVVLVEVISVRSAESYSGQLPVVAAKIIARMDNRKPGALVELRYEGDTSCGPYGPVDLAGVQAGSRYLIFARSGRIDMKGVIAGYAEGELLSAVNRSTWTQLTAKAAR